MDDGKAIEHNITTLEGSISKTLDDVTQVPCITSIRALRTVVPFFFCVSERLIEYRADVMKVD